MDKPPEIIDLAKVVEPHLNGGQLVSYSSRYLTKPGDNYGSVMLAIAANIRRPDGTIEEMPLVAKLPPVTNEIFWNIFQPEVTALRENAIYELVSPSVRQMQLNNGIPESELIEVFAKSYGCRISLNKSATVLDRDAVLVLENLQTSGYRAGKRQIPFDYDHIRLVLKYVAKYHALPIALRMKQPEKFKKDIQPKFLRFSMSQEAETEKEFKVLVVKDISLALGKDEKAVNRYKELDELADEFMTQKNQAEDGLFTTIAHYDLWTNNVMILYDESGAPSKLKIVDFQISQYESLVHDLIFLLFTSVDTNVLENHYEDLLQSYYSEFIDCLSQNKCDISKYSYEKFMDEVNRIAPLQIPHAVFMSRVLLAEDKHMPEDFKDYDMDVLQIPPSEVLLKKLRDIVRLSKKFGFF